MVGPYAYRRIAKLASWSDAEGERVVDAWRSSGESRAAFGRRYGIPVHRLYYWIAAAEKGSKRKHAKQKEAAFHPVRVLPERIGAGAAQIEIRWVRVPQGFAPDDLRAVLRALDHHGYTQG
jgi:transposase-like protein